MDPFENNKMLGPGLEPYSSGFESSILRTTLLSRLFCNVVCLYVISIATTYLHYVIISLYSNITSLCRETEIEAMLSSYFYDAKLGVK